MYPSQKKEWGDFKESSRIWTFICQTPETTLLPSSMLHQYLLHGCHEQDTSHMFTTTRAIQEDLKGGSLGFHLVLYDEKSWISLTQMYETQTLNEDIPAENGVEEWPLEILWKKGKEGLNPRNRMSTLGLEIRS